MNILRKLFLVKEIKSKAGELHFQRWRIFQTKWLSAYIHRIYKGDQDAHCHDHPWNFMTMILSGGYLARNEKGEPQWNLPFKIRFHDAYNFHRIMPNVRGLDWPTTTLVITGKRFRNWGYHVDGKWVDHKTYRKRKHDGTL